MPQIAQQDYIYIDVTTRDSFTDEAKRKIANAIDRGVGLDIVLVLKSNGANVQCRTLAAGITDDLSEPYYVVFWNWEDSSISDVSFSKPDPEPIGGDEN